jgi:hypothetical protein
LEDVNVILKTLNRLSQHEKGDRVKMLEGQLTRYSEYLKLESVLCMQCSWLTYTQVVANMLEGYAERKILLLDDFQELLLVIQKIIDKLNKTQNSLSHFNCGTYILQPPSLQQLKCDIKEATEKIPPTLTTTSQSLQVIQELPEIEQSSDNTKQLSQQIQNTQQ